MNMSNADFEFAYFQKGNDRWTLFECKYALEMQDAKRAAASEFVEFMS